MSGPENFEADEEAPPGAPAWVVTFGDMMSLLLAFFVMMLSFSEIDQVKFKGVIGAIKEAFGVQRMQVLARNPEGPDLDLPRGALDSILDHLNSIMPDDMAGQSLKRSRDGVLLTVPGSVLFNSGKAELKAGMQPYLRGISELLKGKPRVFLQVEGHTDNVPIQTTQFPSNWELSTARSIAVIRFLIESCGVPPSRLAAAGYADTFPLGPNDTPDHRESNRRVEFRFIERKDRRDSLRPEIK
ncbi:MAG: flagellar motor protein MotB [Acidobacteriota bacterium]